MGALGCRRWVVAGMCPMKKYCGGVVRKHSHPDSEFLLTRLPLRGNGTRQDRHRNGRFAVGAHGAKCENNYGTRSARNGPHTLSRNFSRSLCFTTFRIRHRLEVVCGGPHAPWHPDCRPGHSVPRHAVSHIGGRGGRGSLAGGMAGEWLIETRARPRVLLAASRLRMV